MDDYYSFFRGLAAFHEGRIDYEFSVKNMPEFLREEYRFPPPESGEISLILAGIDKNGKQQIRAFTSAYDYVSCTVDEPYIHGGFTKIAYDLFDTQVGANATMESTEIAKLAHQAIASTAEANPSDVNSNVTLRLISKNGITPLA